MKILNLYAGIGGNRKLWKGHQVTAVENSREIAEIYQNFFPKDKVIVADAHQYLLDHYKEYDFIWSSPPCPTHSRTNTFLHAQGIIRYPDMDLYQEIIFLKQWFKGKYIVENVISYYKPLIEPQLIDRHYFWTNFPVIKIKIDKNAFTICNARASTRRQPKDNYEGLKAYHGIKLDLSQSKGLKLLRNCVNPELGKHILDCAMGKIKQKQLL